MKTFLARQPIFDRDRNVDGYELLFRDGIHDAYRNENGDNATSSVLANSFLLIGLDTITGGKRAFINFTPKLIKEEVPRIFPMDLLGIEFSASSTDRSYLEACRNLRDKGYLMVLDDFQASEGADLFIDLADIVKIDVLKGDFAEKKEFAEKRGAGRIKYAAKKVETEKEFELAKRLNFDFFQGFFFMEPVIVSGTDIPGYKLSRLRILSEINKAEVNFHALGELIRCDIALSYKLLRLINSAYFGLREKVKSIHHALVLLGLWEARRWISVLTLSGLAEEKPPELVTTSLLRARFCELLAPTVGLVDHRFNLFLMGMCSALDAIMDRPMEEIITDLPISEMVKTALLGEKNQYRRILDLVLAYEKADWEELNLFAEDLSMNETTAMESYIEAVGWIKHVLLPGVGSEPVRA